MFWEKPNFVAFAQNCL